MNRFVAVGLLFVLLQLRIFGQTNESQPLLVTKFWHPWLTIDSPKCNFLMPSYAVTDDGLWIGGYFNQVEKGRLFKISLPDFKTEVLDTANGKLTTSIACSNDALYASSDRFVNSISVKDGMARYDFASHAWTNRQLPFSFRQDFYLLGKDLYLAANGASNAGAERESAIVKYDWDSDKTTVLASSRRRPGQNQFDDTSPYVASGMFLGPGNKPCVTAQSGTFYIQDTPGKWPGVFDGTVSDRPVSVLDTTLVVNIYGEITLMDPQSPAPIPLMASAEPINRKGPTKEITPWAADTQWDSPGKDIPVLSNCVAFHNECLYLLAKPREKGGIYRLLYYQKGKGRTPHQIPLKFQLDPSVMSSIPPSNGHIPNGWSQSEIEHPDTIIIPPILVTTQQGLCLKLFGVGFWFIPYSDIDTYLNSASN